MRGVETVLGAESGHALDHRGAGDAAVKEEVQNARVDGNSVVLGSIAQVERNFNGLARSQHTILSPRAGRRCLEPRYPHPA